MTIKHKAIDDTLKRREHEANEALKKQGYSKTKGCNIW